MKNYTKYYNIKSELLYHRSCVLYNLNVKVFNFKLTIIMQSIYFFVN